MSDQDRQQAGSRFGLIWPVAAVALALSAWVTTNDPPLVSSRPERAEGGMPAPPAATGISSAHAQLWEDPLESARGATGAGLASPEPVREMLANLVNLDPERFLILPVLIPGGPYPTDHEERMRSRYAVLSALSTSEFKLSYPRRMSAVTVPIVTDFGALSKLAVRNIEVPVKLFSKSELSEALAAPDADKESAPSIRYVLVLWINETQLGQRPLLGLAQLLHQLFPQFRNPRTPAKPAPRLAIIGPSQSGTLLSLLKDDGGWLKQNDVGKQATLDEASLRLFEGQGAEAETYRRWFAEVEPATTDEQVVQQQQPQEAKVDGDPLEEGGPATGTELMIRSFLKRLQVKDHFQRFRNPIVFSPRATVPYESLPFAVPRTFENCGLKLVPTIGSDSSLFKVLAKELQIRGALPTSKRSKDHIVLVTERDTLYGRTVPKAFMNELEVTAERNLHVFTYSRGIDGQTADGGPGDSADDPHAAARLDLPEGTSQRDYLRRLASEIVRFDGELRLRGRGGISAIGVVGSDIFDKLLVLRALRNRFPAALFFTTDLDARYSTPAEYAFTRNLIVVSHFGLNLNRALRYDVPPFRDSYQTSIFFSTLRAIDSRPLLAGLAAKSYLDPWGRRASRNAVQIDYQASGVAAVDRGFMDEGFLEPLAYEIGRTGPFQLNAPVSPVASRIQPQCSRMRSGWSWSLIGLVAAAGAAFFVVFLSSYFMPVKRALRELRKSSHRLLRSVGWMLARRRGMPPLAVKDQLLALGFVATAALCAIVLVDNGRVEGEPLQILEGISVWPSLALMYASIIWAAYLLVTWLRKLKLNFMLMRRDYTSLSGDDYPQTPDGLASPVELLQRYAAAERAWPRLKRVARQTTLFLLFTWLCFLVTNSFPGIPYRGRIAGLSSWLLANLSMLAFYVLSFFVVDVMRTSSRFAVELADGDYDLTRGRLCVGRGELEEPRRRELSELYAIQLIGRYTRLSGRIVLFPFFLALILAAARLTFFDNWDVQLPLVLLTCIVLAGVVIGGLMLRKGAQRARRRLLRRVQQRLADTLAQDSDAWTTTPDRLRNVISEIEAEKRGALRPITEDPLIAAAFIPFGGTGTLVLLEQVFRIF